LPQQQLQLQPRVDQEKVSAAYAEGRSKLSAVHKDLLDMYRWGGWAWWQWWW
jgi:hypothetical protein